MILKPLLFGLAALIACQGDTESPEGGSSGWQNVRQPAVAGQFYSSDSVKLARAVDAYLETAVAATGEKPLAIISPHAGYAYSGQIAADAFQQAASFDYDVIVVLGTNHTTPGFTGVSIYQGKGYRTPLGIAPIDAGLVQQLTAADRDFSFRESVHAREHSIEVQVPFVQRLFPNATIVPAVVGEPNVDLCARLGKALARTLNNRSALIVASSDLSHYTDDENAVRVDRRTLNAVTELDQDSIATTTAKQLGESIPNLVTCACGAGPILTAVAAAKEMGATNARIVSYAHSGHTSIGSPAEVVGYGAVAITAGSIAKSPWPNIPGQPRPPGETELAAEDKKAILAFARRTIRQYLTSETIPLPRGFGTALNQKCGAFVTLERHGNLRGCIGHMAEDLPFCQAVGNCALQAAFNDRRFRPVGADELADMEIEISLLTPRQPIASHTDIEIGRDGVVLEKNGRSAVYLPKVPVEQGWNCEEMLDHLCVKAGLQPGSWKQGANLYTFQAKVFSESDSH